MTGRLCIPQSYIMLSEISEILEHPDFHSMKKFRHHGDIDCYEHTLKVAEAAYELSVIYNADTVSVIRAALLHDFYLYDWHGGGPSWHGFRHPGIALKESASRFRLSELERECIAKHMFPLTPKPPGCKEAWIVNLADKINAVKDYKEHFRKIMNSRPGTAGCGA